MRNKINVNVLEHQGFCYGVNQSIKIVNEVLKDKKRRKRLNTKSGRFFDKLKEFMQTFFYGVLMGASVVVGLCVILPFVGIIFKLVESNDLWAWVFKWALIGGVATTVGATVYFAVKEYIEDRKNKKKYGKK